MRNTRRMNRLEELGRIDNERARTPMGRRNLNEERMRVRNELSGARPMRMMKEGGKAQGYNDHLDESLGMLNDLKKHLQSFKSRRDESKGMEKSMGRKAYASVDTMDKETRKAKGGGMMKVKKMTKAKAGGMMMPKKMTKAKAGGMMKTKKMSMGGRTKMGPVKTNPRPSGITERGLGLLGKKK